ncbi:CdaR family protein [Salirhabdus salicampi]|uniref:CdaR family protein n=1 Tax=Salirhabdus salicampi TaxID=476102 RepID=UPI0020C348AC|nr:CdaR family protein [Salirhabdus salicampi]MCP8618146.1 CdaR family protein [Salirhabdus salicampi]
MDKWLKSPWFNRVLSLILAVLLYTAVSLDQQNVSRTDGTFFPAGIDEIGTMNDVPLQVYMDQEKYVVHGVPAFVSVSVQGPKSVITPTVRQRSFDVFVDIEDLEPGTHEVEVHHRGMSNQLSVSIEPSTIEVTIEEKATRDFLVGIEYINDEKIKDRYIIGQPSLTPNQVEVTGSLSEVGKVTIVKAIVDLAGIEGSQDVEIRNAPVKVYDRQGNELNVYVNPSTVRAEVPIQGTSKNVPISVETIGELEEGLSLQKIEVKPENATIYGLENDIQNITQIDNLTVDLSTITEDRTLETNIPVPTGVVHMEPNKVRVIVDVERTEEKTVEDIDIQFENEGNYTITLLEPEKEHFTITVFGTNSQLQSITAEDFSVSVDVGGYGRGEHELPIQIEGPNNIEYQPNHTNARIRIE